MTRLWVRVAVLAVPGALLAGCGGDGTTSGAATPGCTPMPTTPIILEGEAARFDMTGVAVPTRSFEQDGFLVINAKSDQAIPDLTIAFHDVVRNAGFDIAGSDDEGFEAEVFFARGNIAAGMVVMTESLCPGEVDIKISVLDDPAVLPPGTAPS